MVGHGIGGHLGLLPHSPHSIGQLPPSSGGLVSLQAAHMVPVSLHLSGHSQLGLRAQ